MGPNRQMIKDGQNHSVILPPYREDLLYIVQKRLTFASTRITRKTISLQNNIFSCNTSIFSELNMNTKLIFTVNETTPFAAVENRISETVKIESCVFVLTVWLNYACVV